MARRTGGEGLGRGGGEDRAKLGLSYDVRGWGGGGGGGSEVTNALSESKIPM